MGKSRTPTADQQSYSLKLPTILGVGVCGEKINFRDAFRDVWTDTGHPLECLEAERSPSSYLIIYCHVWISALMGFERYPKLG